MTGCLRRLKTKLGEWISWPTRASKLINFVTKYSNLFSFIEDLRKTNGTKYKLFYRQTQNIIYD